MSHIVCEFCDLYFDNGDIFYGCVIKSIDIPSNQTLTIGGEHKRGKSHKDVIEVKILNCTLTKIPQGLLKIFPNLKILCIWNSKLKYLSRTDLVEYKNLKGFFCNENQVEFLPGDLFEGFENLEWIKCWRNKLEYIDPSILDGLDNLKYVDFRNNPIYNICFSVYGAHQPDSTLQEVKDELSRIFFAKFKFARDLKNSEGSSNEEVKKLRIEVKKISKSSICTDLKKHIMDEGFKDFTIKIDDREFRVHKLLLTIRSPTLAEMLRNNPEAENLKLVDIPVEVFEVILKFMYTDELPQDDNTNFLSIFAAACRLDIKGLKDYAANKILEQSNPKNAQEILSLSNKYGHDGLRQKAFEGIKKIHSKIEFQDEWATDTEKVSQIIEIFKKKEEAIKKIEEDFKKMLSEINK